MHLGNLVLMPTDEQLELAPLYDISPMRFAPVRGEVPWREPKLPERRAIYEEFPAGSLWIEAATLAADFWNAVLAAETLSAEFHQVARAHLELIERHATTWPLRTREIRGRSCRATA